MAKRGERMVAKCHPEEKHHSKEMCKSCYVRYAHKARYANDPAYREKMRARSKAWLKANPERAYLNDMDKHLRRKFGIGREQYLTMLSAQNGVCRICARPETNITRKARVSRLAVDHCHLKGSIRGLLCFKCNTALAHIENTPGILSNIERYLGVSNG